MSYKSDYHVHTWYSDGTKKPTEVVRMFHEKEYDMIAITDHDGTDGINEALIAGEALKIKVIPGIEFSTQYSDDEFDCELHVLGYYIDIDNKKLQDRLQQIREERRIRNERLLDYLKETGYEIEYDDLIQRPGQTYIGKPNFERALRKKDYNTEGIYEVFHKIPKVKISTPESVELIKDAGGISVLAHPMQIRNIGEPKSEQFWNNLDRIVKSLKKNGLKGIECYHPSADEEDSLKLVTLAGKYHLHITEGSDYHEGEI